MGSKEKLSLIHIYTIREALWEGMLRVADIHEKENPYRAAELIEQQSVSLNLLTEKAYRKIRQYLQEEDHDL